MEEFRRQILAGGGGKKKSGSASTDVTNATGANAPQGKGNGAAKGKARGNTAGAKGKPEGKVGGDGGGKGKKEGGKAGSGKKSKAPVIKIRMAVPPPGPSGGLGGSGLDLGFGAAQGFGAPEMGAPAVKVEPVKIKLAKKLLHSKKRSFDVAGGAVGSSPPVKRARNRRCAGVDTVLLNKVFEDVAKELIAEQRFGAFVHMVTRKLVPDYTTYVKKPMCLTKIKESATSTGYQNRAGFLEDVQQILANAQLYHGAVPCAMMQNPAIIVVAQELISSCHAKLAEREAELREAEGPPEGGQAT
eukprot:jgi/Mesvir1/5876/Mv00654-RA.1